MMKQNHRGTLSLMLVACLALVMVLSFGFRAVQTAAECEVSPAQCRYTKVVMTARGPVRP